MLAGIGLNLWVQNISGSQDASRDLSKYRTIGPYTLGYSPELYKDYGKNAAEIREFLWESFQNHHYAHVSVTMYSMEGNKAVPSFFVEPDADGVWMIHYDEVYRSAPVIRAGRRGETRESFKEGDIYYLKRVDIKSKYKSPQYISDSENLTGLQYQLEFLDKDHKKIGGF
jgi:hypothetical protein